ncbi:MAG: hypothetical protein IKJ77_09125 [Firmicutes bacterium]|nr:hypothetical protein [Bacillota bacterium]
MNRKKKKALSMLAVVALIGIIAVGGMLAYLSDKDGEANVFTVGNVDIDLTEEFAQGSPLKPGVTVKKIPTVKNTGKDPAWVWTTVAVPEALDDVIELLDKHSDWDWGTVASKTETIDGIKYTVYTVLHNIILEPGKETEPVFEHVKLAGSVDVDENGKWSNVVNGTVTDLGWKDANGNPVIYVNAYAMQTEEVADAATACLLYEGQWGSTAGDYGKVVSVESAEELKTAIAGGAKSLYVEGAEFTEKMSLGTDVSAIFVDCEFTGNNAWGYANNATFQGCTFDSPDAAIHFDQLKGELVVNDCTFTAGKVQVGAPGTSVFNNCEFAGTTNDSIWSEKGMRFYGEVTFNNCEFNNRVVLAGFNDMPITFNNCTMNNGSPVYYVDNTDGIIRGGNIPKVTIK